MNVKEKKHPRANKELGQHYLNDQNIIKKICADFTPVAKAILEIGPGPAVLTKHLLKTDHPLLVIEKDERFIPILKEILPEHRVIHTDALKADLDTILTSHQMQKNLWLVSNLPYNISSLLLVKFIKCNMISYMTLMFQKEVGTKVLGEGKNNMNSLNALTHAFFTVKKMALVPPGAFAPPPKVDSIVLSFTRIPEKIPLHQIDQYECFLRQIFAQRRKQIGSVFSHPELLEKSGINRTRRAETLTLEEVLLLFTHYGNSNHCKK